MTPGKTLTREDILSWGLEDAEALALPVGWQGTALDILNLAGPPNSLKLRLACRAEWGIPASLWHEWAKAAALLVKDLWCPEHLTGPDFFNRNEITMSFSDLRDLLLKAALTETKSYRLAVAYAVLVAEYASTVLTAWNPAFVAKQANDNALMAVLELSGVDFFEAAASPIFRSGCADQVRTLIELLEA